MKWNKTTALCYFRKMKCRDCPNEAACELASENPFKVMKPRYGLKTVKAQVLQTFEEHGKDGLEKFMEVDIW